MALDGGGDGLEIISLIIDHGIRFLRRGGALFVEIGVDLKNEISKRFKSTEYSDMGFVKDYSGRERILSLIR